MRNELGQADWNLDTLLELLSLLLHRSTKQQYRGVRALLTLVDRDLPPVSVTPLDLLREFIPPIAYGSGGAALSFYSLAELNTPAADEAMRIMLRVSGNARNEDFKRFIQIATECGKSNLLKVLDEITLSQTKAKILRQALHKKEKTDSVSS